MEGLARLPQRDARGHKGTFGTVAVVGGCADEGGVRMIGGAALAAIGALRAGAGLARLAMPEPVLSSGMVIAPSATGVALAVDGKGSLVGHEAARRIDELSRGSDCLVVGPGLGTGEGARAVTVRAAGQEDCPVVLDADALNCLAETKEIRRDIRCAAVITPHPGEFARLARSLGIPSDCGESEQERANACESLARTLGVVVVLKGAGTVVSDGHQTWTLQGADAANPALSTAGTGDVLSGVIGGVIAQAPPPVHAGSVVVRTGGLSLFDAARVGVVAHARAAGLWRERRKASGGMLAMELAEAIPEAMEGLRGG
ncbi:MAG: NAD(P)H-hydrate dehydratase [Phycisphaerales bacterium]